MGIDIGSASSKVVILDKKNNIVFAEAVAGGAGTSGSGRVLQTAFGKTGLEWHDISMTIATGYGRMGFARADKQVSEITCHAMGVYHLMPTVRTIIDIGGQDAKAIQVAPGGLVARFVMNDKCAAGTGRFLEVMARVLETEVNGLGELSLRSGNIVDISSTCTVFAESEVISRLAAGVSTADVAAGVHQSVARRVAGIAMRAGVEPDVILTGGVAKNEGVVEALTRELNLPVLVAPHCQLTGALGAALIAMKQISKSSLTKKIV